MAEEKDDGSKGAKMSRKEKRKAAKKTKRQLLRREKASEHHSSPEDSAELRSLELEEAERSLREKLLWEERDRAWLESRAAINEQPRHGGGDDGDGDDHRDGDGDDGWEYVEEGPPEIIWQGNEIILKKKKVRVPRSESAAKSEDNAERPISNPLPPPESNHQSSSSVAAISGRGLIESVTPQQIPNFGTEQDKAHCPFHLKTGVCRFGQRCSRVHFYADKSCTLLIKNMYSGPGLAWEQDEGLEYSEEEVERSYEEFYEDVHTEFLKFGEIVNFKVCRNGSFHLRGNVYIHFKSLDSAVLAYHSINARYFAGKQLSCEFVNVSRWKVAICGEYMKTRFKTCSRGTACNFIHCFRNPGGEYEWSDSDKPPPRYWVKKMIALFGYSDESANEQHTDRLNRSNRILTTDVDRHYSRRSRSREREHSRQSSSSSRRRRRDHVRNDLIEDEDQHRKKRKVHRRDSREPHDRTRKSSRNRSENEFRESGSETDENLRNNTKRSFNKNKKRREKWDDDDIDDCEKDDKYGSSSDYGDLNRERRKSREKNEDPNEKSDLSSKRYDVDIYSRDRWEPEPESEPEYERYNKS